MTSEQKRSTLAIEYRAPLDRVPYPFDSFPRISSRSTPRQRSATRIQAFFRGYSVRVFLRRAASPPSLGTSGAPAPPLPGKKDKETPAQRVRRDYAMRRRWEREASIAELKRLDQESTRWGRGIRASIVERERRSLVSHQAA